MLRVGAGLVGTRISVVVEGEGVVPVVQVDQTKIHVKACTVREIDSQLAAPGEFVEVVGVVGVKMDVVESVPA